VTVIPALMISISGGLIVTRSSSDAEVGTDFHKQVFSNARPLLLASGVLVALAAFPGLPRIPFLLMGGGLGTVAWRMRKKSIAANKAPEPGTATVTQEGVEALLRVEPLAVEVGYGLVRMVEGGQSSPLLRRIAGIRRQLASDLGYVVPPVKVTDNVALRVREYTVSIKGAEVARYELPQGSELAIPVGKMEAPPNGAPTREPAFGMSGWWIPSETAERARRSGFTVVDAVSVMGTHLSELIRKHAHELFSRQDAKKFLDRVTTEHPKVVEDLVPKLLSLAAVQRVLQNLLRERVSIRDGVSILEALGEAAATTRNPVLLTEYVRQAIRRTVVRRFMNQSGDLPAYVIDSQVEHAVESAVEHGEQNSHLAMAPQTISDLLTRMSKKVGRLEGPVAALCSSGSRYFLRQLVEHSLPNLYFISHNEIPANVKVVSMGTIQ